MNRIDQSVSNLLSIIRGQNEQIQLLADVITLLTKEGITLEGTPVDVIRDIYDLVDYLNKNDIDYLVLVIPGVLPRAYDREELDIIHESGTLEKWLKEEWKEETVALAI